MESINNHTYKIGVDSYHYIYTCFGFIPSHLAWTCNAQFCSEIL
ncbi:hypothetical protein ADIWIN_3441 [Winogradskyella psychrotolerans RS-3]|uniref:Uncharacterized protein n=2 Tax=Winogradskyella TaxID=286104 RepID=S7WVM3_9FLAO|nr:hypothetical protein ADIWIN_3441 [Winogradskyella psychrotolerans RS-3]